MLIISFQTATRRVTDDHRYARANVTTASLGATANDDISTIANECYQTNKANGSRRHLNLYYRRIATSSRETVHVRSSKHQRHV